MAIYIPKHRLITPDTDPSVMKPATLGINGRYRVELRDELGNLKQEIPWTHNLLTNRGIQVASYGGQPFANAWFGDGGTAPAFSDTALSGNYLSPRQYYDTTWSNSRYGNLGAPDYVMYQQFRYVSETNENVGTIREFATSAWADDQLSDPICMRVVFPTPIVKGAGDYLTVYYEYFLYRDLSDVTGVLQIEGVDYNYTLRPQGVQLSNPRPEGGWMNSKPFGNYQHHNWEAGGLSYADCLTAYPITHYSNLDTPNNEYEGARICSSIKDYVTTGDGLVGYTRQQSCVWNIDYGNTSFGVRAFSFIPQWSNDSNGGKYRAFIERVSDGAPHPKENTHELTFAMAITTKRGDTP